MVHFFSILLFLLSTTTFANNLDIKLTSDDLAPVINSIEQEVVEKQLRDFLRVSTPSRYYGTQGHRAAKQFIIDTIKSSQLSKDELLTVQDFTPDIDYAINIYRNDFNQYVVGQISESDPEYRKWERYTNSFISTLQGLRSVTGQNLIWEKKGSDLTAPMLVVVTNYDTMAVDKEKMVATANQLMPGADHNASGVVAGLQLIKALQKIKLKRSVQVIFLDLEAVGFLGSRSLSKTLVANQVDGIINLLMLGSDRVSSDKLKQEGNRRIYGPQNKAKEMDLAKFFIEHGNRYQTEIKCQYLDNSFRQGSAFTFWEQSLPAIVFTHDWENDSNEARAFTSDDFIETLNLKTFANSIKYMAGAILSWAVESKQ